MKCYRMELPIYRHSTHKSFKPSTSETLGLDSFFAAFHHWAFLALQANVSATHCTAVPRPPLWRGAHFRPTCFRNPAGGRIIVRPNLMNRTHQVRPSLSMPVTLSSAPMRRMSPQLRPTGGSPYGGCCSSSVSAVLHAVGYYHHARDRGTPPRSACALQPG